MLVNFEYIGQDRPPDFEFVGLVDVENWKPKETLAEAIERKNQMYSKYHKQNRNENTTTTFEIDLLSYR